jgi:hypothetical protein
MTPPVLSENATYPAKQFAAGALFCPDCRVRLAEPVSACPACGFTGERTLALFPGGAPPMQEFMDQAQCWSKANQKKLQGWVAEMRRLFPQIHWCLLSIELPKETRLRLFNFWFFNVSPVSDATEAEQRSWTILLTHDVANQRLAITPGYQVEPILADDSWEQILVMMKKSYQENGAMRGYRDFFRDCEARLMDASKRMNERLNNREGGRQ